MGGFTLALRTVVAKLQEFGHHARRVVRARLTRGVGGVLHFLGSDGADFWPIWLEEAMEGAACGLNFRIGRHRGVRRPFGLGLA